MATGKKRGAPAPRPRSGFVREDQRHTERVSVRLRPEIAEVLKAAAEANEMTVSALVEHAVLRLAEELEPTLRMKRVAAQYGDIEDATVRRLLGLPPKSK